MGLLPRGLGRLGNELGHLCLGIQVKLSSHHSVCEAAQQCNCKLAVCCFFFALLLYIGVTLSTLVIFTGASCFLVCLIPMECVPLLIWAIFVSRTVMAGSWAAVS